jgi:putative membrane protein
MKINIVFMMFLTLVIVASINSCNPKKSPPDSKDVAEEQNKATFDTTSVEDDVQFAIAAADGGLLEVQLGNLALTNASSAEVKKFGQSMIDDHSGANKELAALASQKNITLPQTLSEKNQKHYDELQQKKGKEFDEAYTDFMVKDHKEDIDEFKKEAVKGNDKDLQSWAQGKVPVLEHHLSMAQQAQESLKNK